LYHLALLALGRRRQCDDAEHARTHALGDRLDRAALAGAVAALEQDADLQALVYHPLLQLDQFDVQLLQFTLVVLARQLGPILRGRRCGRRDWRFAIVVIFALLLGHRRLQVGCARWVRARVRRRASRLWVHTA
jgi:hypothetical protein